MTAAIVTSTAPVQDRLISGYALTPVDAWTFRDGRPGSPWSGASMDLECHFPPPASTVIGAIRAALARGQGWKGKGAWDPSLNSTLGDGPNDLGKLIFTGPFLRRGVELVFAMPTHVLGEAGQDGKWSPRTFLVPGQELSCDLCDLGKKIRLPQAVAPPTTGEVFKEPSGLFVTASGLKAILDGLLPNVKDVVSAKDLFVIEHRIGLEIEDTTGTAAEGQLFSPQFVRLKENVEIVCGADEVPGDWTFDPMFPLGGESRFATCDPTSFVLPNHTANLNSKSRNAAIILLTPARKIVNGRHLPKPGESIIDGVTLISACCERPIRLGGWNSIKGQPEPQVPHLPAGSVLFVNAEDDAAMKQLLTVEHMGERTAHGLGRCVIGVWPDKANATGKSHE